MSGGCFLLPESFRLRYLYTPRMYAGEPDCVGLLELFLSTLLVLLIPGWRDEKPHGTNSDGFLFLRDQP